MYLLYFYVPESHCEKVKTALFDAGAGKFNDYDCCCWQVKGRGQFRPLEKSNPFLGSKGRLEKVEEMKVEMICSDEIVKKIVTTLKKAHPYEEPAYGLIKMDNFEPL